MGRPQARKKHHKAHRPYSYSRQRVNLKDIDQVYDDIVGKGNAEEGKVEPPKEFDHDLPGGGLHLCRECDRYFIDNDMLEHHLKSKQHKRRVKQLGEVPDDLAIQRILNPVDNGPAANARAEARRIAAEEQRQAAVDAAVAKDAKVKETAELTKDLDMDALGV